MMDVKCLAPRHLDDSLRDSDCGHRVHRSSRVWLLFGNRGFALFRLGHVGCILALFMSFLHELVFK